MTHSQSQFFSFSAPRWHFYAFLKTRHGIGWHRTQNAEGIKDIPPSKVPRKKYLQGADFGNFFEVGIVRREARFACFLAVGNWRLEMQRAGRPRLAHTSAQPRRSAPACARS